MKIKICALDLNRNCYLFCTDRIRTSDFACTLLYRLSSHEYHTRPVTDVSRVMAITLALTYHLGSPKFLRLAEPRTNMSHTLAGYEVIDCHVSLVHHDLQMTSGSEKSHWSRRQVLHDATLSFRLKLVSNLSDFSDIMRFFVFYQVTKPQCGAQQTLSLIHI